LVADPDAPVIARRLARQRRQQRGLAHAVAAEHGETITGGNREGNALEIRVGP
jgi:hypothetical protein